jgi:hypothetical protein
VADALTATLLARLRDRQPGVRAQAALALARLADPGEARALPLLAHHPACTAPPRMHDQPAAWAPCARPQPARLRVRTAG